jgi:hypothetical protein
MTPCCRAGLALLCQARRQAAIRLSRWFANLNRATVLSQQQQKSSHTLFNPASTQTSKMGLLAPSQARGAYKALECPGLSIDIQTSISLHIP